MSIKMNMAYEAIHERSGIGSYSNFIEENKEQIMKEITHDELIELLQSARDNTIKSEETKEYINNFIESLNGKSAEKQPVEEIAEQISEKINSLESGTTVNNLTVNLVETKKPKLIDRKLIRLFIDKASEEDKSGIIKKQLLSLSDDDLIKLILGSIENESENTMNLIKDALLNNSDVLDDENLCKKPKQESVCADHQPIVPIIVKEEKNAQTIIPDLNKMVSEEEKEDEIIGTNNIALDYSSLSCIKDKRMKKAIKRRIINAINNDDFYTKLSGFICDNSSTIMFSLNSYQNEREFTIATDPRLYCDQMKRVYFTFFKEGGGEFSLR